MAGRRATKKEWTIFAAVAAAIFVVVFVVGVHRSNQPAGSSTASSTKYDAFDVCEQFVRQRLKAPSTATFRDPTADNGDTVITPSRDGTVWVVTSSVDAQNSFGAKLRQTFTCTVRHVSGAKFNLVSLDMG